MPARVKKFFCIFCSLFSFFGHTTPFTPKSGLIGSVKLCFSDHGSLVIFRSASVRPKHLFDPYFDHDYLFKLPLTRERDAPSLTMPARVKKFFCIFCSLFSFFGHTTPFTPKSRLIGSVKLC